MPALGCGHGGLDWNQVKKMIARARRSCCIYLRVHTTRFEEILMKIVKQNASLVWVTPDAEKMIERIGRVCYKSEDKISEDSAGAFDSYAYWQRS